MKIAKKGMASVSPAFLRKDRPYDLLRAYWRGPHGFLVSHTEGVFSYIQYPFDEGNYVVDLPYHVDTTPKEEWVFDGIAETYMDHFSDSLKGLTSKVSKETYKDEQNAFSRTLLYSTMPGGAVYYRADLEGFDATGKKEGERIVLFIKSRKKRALKKFLKKKLIPVLYENETLKEIKSYVFMGFNENLWKAENVAHDHPKKEQFAAAIILGADKRETVLKALNDEKVVKLIDSNKKLFKAIYAFNNTDTFVMRYNNHPTKNAIRGPQMIDFLLEVGADNQLTDIFEERVTSQF